jgi:hypothetical protein
VFEKILIDRGGIMLISKSNVLKIIGKFVDYPLDKKPFGENLQIVIDRIINTIESHLTSHVGDTDLGSTFLEHVTCAITIMFVFNTNGNLSNDYMMLYYAEHGREEEINDITINTEEFVEFVKYLGEGGEFIVKMVIDSMGYSLYSKANLN